jgi:hypothetical protein
VEVLFFLFSAQDLGAQPYKDSVTYKRVLSTETTTASTAETVAASSATTAFAISHAYRDLRSEG